MGQEIQLELNIENRSDEELQFYRMQKQIDAISDSTGKVRRCVFAELGSMKKLYVELKAENELLRSILKEIKNEKEEWTYGKNGYLFALQDNQRKLA